MPTGSTTAGVAALSICESILLSLIDNNVIDAAEAKAILEDAAAAHREEARLLDGSGGEHAEVASLIEGIIENGNSVRRAPRP